MLFEVRDIYKSYKKSSGIIKKERVEIVRGVSFAINKGECLGIVGESGSGKSTLARLILGVEDIDRGSIVIDGMEVSKKGRKSVNKKVSVVFQDYGSSVNSRLKVKDILAEPIKIFQKLSKKDMQDKVVCLLEKVGLSEDYLYRYPHELSGGQLQRVCIARAIATTPKFIVLDEAISSLDVSIQVQILDLLIQLKQDMDISYVFITHDLAAVTYICDRVIFFKEGAIVEEVSCIGQLKNVKEEYSKALLNAVMTMDLKEETYETQRIS